ncbi:MFS transporter [Mesorhizobium sp. M0213]
MRAWARFCRSGEHIRTVKRAAKYAQVADYAAQKPDFRSIWLATEVSGFGWLMQTAAISWLMTTNLPFTRGVGLPWQTSWLAPSPPPRRTQRHAL